jgi:hypothetical protein
VQDVTISKYFDEAMLLEIAKHEAGGATNGSRAQ